MNVRSGCVRFLVLQLFIGIQTPVLAQHLATFHQNADTRSDSIFQISSPELNPHSTKFLYASSTAWVDSMLASLSVEEKVGQLLLAYSSSFYKSQDEETFVELSDLIEARRIGGVMFSKGNVYEVAMLANQFQAKAKVPLLVSADMEYGVAMRIYRTTEFPSNMALSATRSPGYAYKMGQIIAKEARALGIHQNYAPTVDLNNNPENPIINTRAFSEKIDLTNVMSKAFINGLQNGGLIATAKHFPGHGDTEIDSHKDLPVLPFKKSRLDALELQPFKAAVTEGIMSVMVGHLALPEIVDDESVPATLSKEVTSRILRQEMGFNGLVVTDAMTMHGVRKGFDVGEAAVRAVNAGNDLVLMSPDLNQAYDAILDAVNTNRITMARLNESVRRILIAKDWLNLHNNRFVDFNAIPGQVGIQAHKDLAQEIADHSITLLRNKGTILPLTVKTSWRKKILHVTLQNVESRNVGKTFQRELRKRFVTDHHRIDPLSNQLNYNDVYMASKKSAAIVVSCFVDVRLWADNFGLDKDQTRFLKKLTYIANKENIPLILVSFGSPYVIMGHDDIPVYLCAYTGVKVSQISVAKLLNGEISPKGYLPITIPGAFKYNHGLGFSGPLPEPVEVKDYLPDTKTAESR
jgi:beta-N-acetylhexosaminidase